MDKIIKNLTLRFPELSDIDILISVETIIEAMSTQLINGGRIELRKFGIFSVNAPSQEMTDIEIIEVDKNQTDTTIICFKPGRKMREKINSMSLDIADQ